jgi:hypothetical protein
MFPVKLVAPQKTEMTFRQRKRVVKHQYRLVDDVIDACMPFAFERNFTNMISDDDQCTIWIPILCECDTNTLKILRHSFSSSTASAAFGPRV